jgi:hypothetical protein
MCVLVKDLVDVCVRVVVLFAVARYVRCRHLRAKRVGGSQFRLRSILLRPHTSWHFNMPFSYWPGGIPSYIKFDDVPIANDKIDELTNGWKLFVKVNSYPVIGCFQYLISEATILILT